MMFMQAVAAEENNKSEYFFDSQPSDEKNRWNYWGKKKIRKENSNSKLPSFKVVYENHRLLVAYCEGKVAEALLKLNSQDAVLIPDVTWRQDVGQVAATTPKIGDKN